MADKPSKSPRVDSERKKEKKKKKKTKDAKTPRDNNGDGNGHDFPNIEWREGELEKIEEFRKRVEGMDRGNTNDDNTLKRFLRARDGDVDKAFAMYTNHLAWRKEWDIDTILDREDQYPIIKIMDVYWPGCNHGEDREGNLVYIERIGHVDVKGVIGSIPADVLLHWQRHGREHDRVGLEKRSKERGRVVDQITMIEDCQGLGMKHLYMPAVDVYKEVLKMSDEQYPETLRRYLVVNPPTIFPIIYKMLSPFVDPHTLEKIIMVPSDPQERNKVLAQYVDPQYLPEEWGGTCKSCPNGCIPVGGKFNPLRPNGTTYFPTGTVVGRRAKHEVEVQVEHVGSKLTWEFSTKGHDIGFAVYYKGETKEEIVANERHDASKAKVTGEHIANKAGTYLFIWDNSYSSLRKKELTFEITLTPPAKVGGSNPATPREKKKKKKKEGEKQ